MGDSSFSEEKEAKRLSRRGLGAVAQAGGALQGHRKESFLVLFSKKNKHFP
jgi:hypothetical protein